MLSIPGSMVGNPLVEVVGGEKTGSAAIERALAFYTAIGKQPIHVRREVPGHVANRLQAALWREALHLGGRGDSKRRRCR
jgi:carnitine 3-dehydrogenase